jgi:hypothetical protein
MIPASALTVSPGVARVLKETGGSQITEGTVTSLKGTFDKSILVTVQPGYTGTDTKTIFIMNPKLMIKVPKSTPPGHYRGTLTITSL